ncbi:MAG TPA: RNA-binding protein [Patescibacteria group bacterium]|nr:RNA-binding protein [Patescibacteria group bacterium]
MNKKLYVGNLLYEITEDDLKAHFSQYGSVVSATIIRFQDGRSKGFGFVEMGSEEEVKKAIDGLNEQDYKGRKIVVAEARPPRPREDFGGGGGQRKSGFDSQGR